MQRLLHEFIVLYPTGRTKNKKKGFPREALTI